MIFASKPLVFVSYSRKDKEKVDELSRRLVSRGIRIWVDTQDIVGGEWRQNIKRALRQSNFFLACLSQNTTETGEALQYEWDSALEIQRERLEGEIYLLPIRLEPCEIPDGLKHLECLDLYEPQGWDRLVRALRSKSTSPPLLLPGIIGVLLLLGLLGGVYWWLQPSSQSDFIAARSKGKSAPVSRTVQLGLTFWKMEPSKDSDPLSTRDIVHPPPSQVAQSAPDAWTPVRLSSGQEFHLGDRFQAGIESSRSGFLYVVNRAFRADGSAGPASLIFPTTRISGGDNYVWPSRLIRLPDRKSDPPFWEFTSTRSDYAGEILMVLLVPRALDGFSTQAESIPVSDETIGDWVRRYGGGVHSKPIESRALRLTVEEAAARDQATQLPGSAPLPQVIFEADRAVDAGTLVTYQIKVNRVH